MTRAESGCIDIGADHTTLSRGVQSAVSCRYYCIQFSRGGRRSTQGTALPFKEHQSTEFGIARLGRAGAAEIEVGCGIARNKARTSRVATQEYVAIARGITRQLNNHIDILRENLRRPVGHKRHISLIVEYSASVQLIAQWQIQLVAEQEVNGNQRVFLGSNAQTSTTRPAVFASAIRFSASR